MINKANKYYLPEPSKWPIIGSIGIFTLLFGVINWLHQVSAGPYIALAGLAIILYMVFGWFGAVIHENLTGLHNKQMDKTFRIAMCWFIFTEIMFFGSFFGALFYARVLSTEWLAGHGDAARVLTHYLLWPDFSFQWPLLQNPDPSKFMGPKYAMTAAGLPAINTLLLLTSGVTVTWAHHALRHNNRPNLIIGLALTILLGISFLFCQAFEYHHAYVEMGLTLASGIYGTTFFMLTGFHGLHVTLGTIMLIVIWVRSVKGHFRPDAHFAFEGVAWYWHFVDVVWLFLYMFVYWL